MYLYVCFSVEKHRGFIIAKIFLSIKILFSKMRIARCVFVGQKLIYIG